MRYLIRNLGGLQRDNNPAHYRIDAADGTYSAGAYGSIGLEAPSECDTVIPYADLTEATVIGWMKQYLTAEKVAEVESALQVRIDEQHAPTTATGKPW